MTPTLKAKLREELGSLTSDAKLARVYRAVLEGPEHIEAMARAICRNSFDGYDPDQMVFDKAPSWVEGSLPRGRQEGECEYVADGEHMIYWRRWRLFIPQAKAALDALLSQGEAVE